jgi:hypothetical protein
MADSLRSGIFVDQNAKSMKYFPNRRFLFLLLILGTFAAGSCKKYPDGPEFSLLPKKIRLAEDWKINKMYENGVDITSKGLAHIVHDSRDIKVAGGFSYSMTTDNGTSLSYSGTWSWSSDKTVLYFTYALGAGVQEDTYLILRLKEDDLWLQNVSPTGDVMEYHFIPN